MASVTFDHVYKYYKGENKASVQDFHLRIEDGEFLVLVGPSGCGKSTTLRMLAGLEELSRGDLYIGDRLINYVPPKSRDIAMVFQNYALYPNLSVYENMAFGLKLRKTAKHEVDLRVKQAAKILEIHHLLDKVPGQLSGGQKQRTALGRAIVRQPQVFLMDEPLSNLDAKLRAQTRAEIAKMHKRLQTTTVYVTHDQIEAMTMGTRIVVMKDGIIQQAASPQELYDAPANQFVAGFIGSPQMNFMKGSLVDRADRCFFETKRFSLEVPEPIRRRLHGASAGNRQVVLGIRPEHIIADPLQFGGREDHIVKAVVELKELVGADVYLYLKCAEDTLVSRAEAHTPIVADETIEVALRMDKAHFFDADSGVSIQT